MEAFVKAFKALAECPHARRANVAAVTGGVGWEQCLDCGAQTNTSVPDYPPRVADLLNAWPVVMRAFEMLAAATKGMFDAPATVDRERADRMLETVLLGFFAQQDGIDTSRAFVEAWVRDMGGTATERDIGCALFNLVHAGRIERASDGDAAAKSTLWRMATNQGGTK